jgi:tyrosinase
VLITFLRIRGSLSGEERIAYTNAVLCLQKGAAKSPASFAAGAKTRYDDWVASHINQTLTIHYTGTFLAWHRYFTWHYEQALRNECGYNGTQPYWDWSITAKTGTEGSPIWDGSATSLSGNGAPIANKGEIVLGGIPGVPPIILPAGSGGGCITSGPFKDMKVNLGPAALPVPGNITVAQKDPTAYNPRCLKRDLTNYVNQRFANVSSILDLVYKHLEIEDFQMTMQGYPGSGELGVHGGGHYTMGMFQVFLL